MIKSRDLLWAGKNAGKSIKGGDAKTLGNAVKRAGEFMGALERA